MGLFVETKVGKSTLSWLAVDDEQKSYEEVHQTWCKFNFQFIEENVANKIIGLRPPQVGGIFATLGFEKSDENVATTIVMPTGTGKTETILSIVVAGKFKRTLIVVPSDPLRKQTKDKFIKLGLLRQFGLIGKDIANPVVATIQL
ncbi:DEAD/DEAH box helicase family protein [Psychromonas sp. KJ10-10]|uniref:DEAD/DEAH box helicase family protein n=1 Tax=Psychromonas sp. KJ10-10 TaxID=3391823 RepID=UPI0039B5B07F